MEFLYKRRFLEAFDRLPRTDQSRVMEAERRIRAFYETRMSPHGLGVKKLFSGHARVFEARAGLRLRLLWVQSPGIVSFVFLGTHDEVRRYLRSFA